MQRPSIAAPAAWLLAALLLPVLACSGRDSPPPRPPNLLVILADDVGTERIGIYGESPRPVRTPHIDRLGRTGLVFANFWAMPVCSPARAALLTGRYPHRNGIGTVIKPDSSPGVARRGLAADTDTLPRALAGAGYTSVIVGKWHLATRAQGLDHPLQLGFAHHRGSFGNLADAGGHGSYFSWTKLVDGVPGRSKVYATTDTVNDAIAFARELPQPWLLLVSFNAAHWPSHVPPPELHGYRTLRDARREMRTAFDATVEAMDTEIGRLLEAVEPMRPFVFFLADNGSANRSYGPSEPDRGRGKASLFESGVRVPFIVNHPSIVAPGRRVDGLASITDLYATLVELAGIERDPSELPPDSVSLVPYLRSARAESPRDWLLAERFRPNGPPPHRWHVRAVRDRRYKLITTRSGKERFYDLASDPHERRPLTRSALKGPAAEAYRRLRELNAAAPPVAGATLSPGPAGR